MTEHFTDDQLVCLVDGELAEAGHLDQCAECRARYLEAGDRLAFYNSYHHDVLKPSLAAPPKPWADLSELVLVAQATPPALLVAPRSRSFSIRWLAAAAAIVLAIFVARRLDQPAQVSAAELLRRASSAPVQPSTHRRIRVQTRSRTFVRPAVMRPLAGAADSEAELRALFQQAKYNWDDPLSVRSYVAWREQLGEMRDEVSTTPERGEPQVYLVRTTTSDGALVEATLALRAADLHPIHGTLRFSENEVVEISELSEERPVVESAPSRPTTPAPLPAAPGPSDELHVWAALHRIGADLGEPVEVERRRDRIAVTVTGLDARRREQLTHALASMDHVELRYLDPRPRTESAARREAVAETSTPPAGALLGELESRLGSRASVDQFVDRVLVSSDAVLSRAHALRSLAQRFPAEVEATMPPEDRALLASISRDHVQGLDARFAELHSTLASALADLGHTPPQERAVQPGAWQPTAIALFNAARTLDELVNSLLAPGSSGTTSRRADLQPAIRAVELEAASLAALLPR